MKQFNLEDLIFDDAVLLEKEGENGYGTHGDGWYLIETQEKINAISASVTGGGAVWLKDGEIHCSGPVPSAAHQWQNDRWVINRQLQDEILHQHQTALLQLLANKTDDFKTQYLAGYPQTEIDSFYRQEKEALAYMATPTAQTPMLRRIAEERNVPFDLLVQKVIEKSGQFALMIGTIVGQRQAFEDRILGATGEEALHLIEKEIEAWQAN